MIAWNKHVEVHGGNGSQNLVLSFGVGRQVAL